MYLIIFKILHVKRNIRKVSKSFTLLNEVSPYEVIVERKTKKHGRFLGPCFKVIINEVIVVRLVVVG